MTSCIPASARFGSIVPASKGVHVASGLPPESDCVPVSPPASPASPPSCPPSVPPELDAVPPDELDEVTPELELEVVVPELDPELVASRLESLPPSSPPPELPLLLQL
jgi:hypothetical protein